MQLKQPFADVPQNKVLLKISQNSQENTCVRVSFLISCRLRFFHRTPPGDGFGCNGSFYEMKATPNPKDNLSAKCRKSQLGERWRHD